MKKLRGMITVLPSALAIALSATVCFASEGTSKDPRLSEVFRDCSDCPDMVVIPPGAFEMGADNLNIDAHSLPHRRIIIGKAFALSKTEITQKQWQAIMGNNPSRFRQCGDNCPVDNVSWDDAHEFIRKLNAKSGKQYRLPSEAEWEYACRAGSSKTDCGGDLTSVAWFRQNSGGSTHKVATKQANAFGLYDMLGNVSEWVEDQYHIYSKSNDANYYRTAPSDGSPWLGGDASTLTGQRVIRGSSWEGSASNISATGRFPENPASRDMTFGLRVARTLPR